MREIKFRGKDVKGEWRYGDLTHNKKVTTTGLEPRVMVGGYEVIEDTVGQFTGLYDKNGNEVYEGDLLRFPPKKQWEEKNFIAFEVFWHDNDCADRHIGWQMNRLHFQGCICGADTGVITFLPKWVNKMIVIGNVFDNKELITK